jgi:pimeloyl-ACP methyl ester carboxylesterase
MAALSPRHRMIAIDNRGTGRSEKVPGPYSIDMMADDAAAVLRVLKLRTAHVVGTSMGGYIALALAKRHPALVQSLVLVATSKGGPGTLPVPASTLEAWRAASVLSPREFAERTMPLSYRPGWAEENRQRFVEVLETRLEFPTPPMCWAAQYAACEQYIYQGLDVSTLEQPALVIHGTQDRVVPFPNGEALAAALPHSRLKILEGAGHLPFIEDPKGFARIVSDFLKSPNVADR